MKSCMLVVGASLNCNAVLHRDCYSVTVFNTGQQKKKRNKGKEKEKKASRGKRKKKIGEKEKNEKKIKRKKKKG